MKASIKENNNRLISEAEWWTLNISFIKSTVRRSGKKGYEYRSRGKSLITTISPDKLREIVIKQVHELIPELADVDLGYLKLLSLQKLIRNHEIVKVVNVAPGEPVVGLEVGGTYFGSGSYDTITRTNGLKIKAGVTDTGVAVEEHYNVVLEKGQSAYVFSSAYPGGTYITLYVAV